MSKRYYTKTELENLLDSEEITEEFRDAIKQVLADGSDDAVRSLGEFGATARPNQKADDQEPRQARESEHSCE